MQPLIDNEVERLVAHHNPMTARGYRNIAILMTFLGTGIRESELYDLRMDQLNLDMVYFKVMGKGSKERIVPIGKLGQKILWKYLFHFRPEPINDANDYVFLSIDGKRLTPNAIRHFLSRWGRNVGVPRLHAHLCRHTFATNFLIHSCGDGFRLQQILRHTTDGTEIRSFHS